MELKGEAEKSISCFDMLADVGFMETNLTFVLTNALNISLLSYRIVCLYLCRVSLDEFN